MCVYVLTLDGELSFDIIMSANTADIGSDFGWSDSSL